MKGVPRYEIYYEGDSWQKSDFAKVDAWTVKET